MGYDDSSISQVLVQSDGPDLLISWVSQADQGAVFQVYVDHGLSWSGSSRRCHVPTPAGASGRNLWVDVGVVDPADAQTDFSGSLASLQHGGPKTQLSWQGATYLDPSGNDDVQGFRVYGSKTPNTAVDLTSPVADVPAYPGGWVCDGFGLGGCGLGGFGRAATSYLWTCDPLPGGTWQFSVVPYDKQGNDRGPGQNVNLAVTAAPRPPAASAGGTRLSYSYSGPATRQVTLNWLASPSS